MNSDTVKVLYPYNGKKSGSMRINPGDLLEIVSISPDGWFLGKNIYTDEEGKFPVNYVELQTAVHKILSMTCIFSELRKIPTRTVVVYVFRVITSDGTVIVEKTHDDFVILDEIIKQHYQFISHYFPKLPPEGNDLHIYSEYLRILLHTKILESFVPIWLKYHIQKVELSYDYTPLPNSMNHLKVSKNKNGTKTYLYHLQILPQDISEVLDMRSGRRGLIANTFIPSVYTLPHPVCLPSSELKEPDLKKPMEMCIGLNRCRKFFLSLIEFKSLVQNGYAIKFIYQTFSDSHPLPTSTCSIRYKRYDFIPSLSIMVEKECSGENPINIELDEQLQLPLELEKIILEMSEGDKYYVVFSPPIHSRTEIDINVYTLYYIELIRVFDSLTILNSFPSSESSSPITPGNGQLHKSYFLPSFLNELKSPKDLIENEMLKNENSTINERIKEPVEIYKTKGKNLGMHKKKNSLSRSYTFTLKELQSNTTFPIGFDTSRKEMYLSDDEFITLFCMSKDAFSELPLSKRRELKLQYNIF